MKVEDRFWSKVDKTGECWEWTAGKNTGGYGIFWYKKENCLAHRVSWELSRGMPPESDMVVCHKCDNTACVNPDHLFLASRRENILDMFEKKRNRGFTNRFTSRFATETKNTSRPPLKKLKLSLIEAIALKTKETDGKCKRWGGFKIGGVAKYTYNTKQYTVAKVLYEHHHQVILKRKDIVRSVCGTPGCIEPTHLKIFESNFSKF